MRVDSLNQPQVELAHELEVAVDLFQHRVDDQRLTAMPTGDEVSICALDAVEELAEKHKPRPSPYPDETVYCCSQRGCGTIRR